jgi:hypothetical protein
LLSPVYEEEESNSRSYMKYATFVLDWDLQEHRISVYQQQIANETVLVESAVQKQVENKIQGDIFLSKPMPAVTLSIKRVSCPIM